MNQPAEPLRDQAEVLAENAQLELQARNLRAQLAVKGRANAAPSMPESAKADCLAINAAIKAHVAELQAALEGKQATAKPKTGQGGNLTARILAARGVKTLAELPKPSGLD